MAYVTGKHIDMLPQQTIADALAARDDLIEKLRREIEGWKATVAALKLAESLYGLGEGRQVMKDLRKDAGRLNWLEAHPRHAQIAIDGRLTDCVFYGISCAQLVKLREAIDRAMKESEK